MRQHILERHPETDTEKPAQEWFTMKVHKKFSTALERQLGEAVCIARSGGAGASNLLNRRDEFSRCIVPEITLDEGWRGDIRQKRNREEVESQARLGSSNKRLKLQNTLVSTPEEPQEPGTVTHQVQQVPEDVSEGQGALGTPAEEPQDAGTTAEEEQVALGTPPEEAQEPEAGTHQVQQVPEDVRERQDALGTPTEEPQDAGTTAEEEQVDLGTPPEEPQDAGVAQQQVLEDAGGKQVTLGTPQEEPQDAVGTTHQVQEGDETQAQTPRTAQQVLEDTEEEQVAPETPPEEPHGAGSATHQASSHPKPHTQVLEGAGEKNVALGIPPEEPQEARITTHKVTSHPKPHTRKHAKRNIQTHTQPDIRKALVKLRSKSKVSSVNKISSDIRDPQPQPQPHMNKQESKKEKKEENQEENKKTEKKKENRKENSEEKTHIRTDRSKNEDEIDTNIQRVNHPPRADVIHLPAMQGNRKVAPQTIKKRPKKKRANLQPSQAQVNLFRSYFSGTKGGLGNAEGLEDQRVKQERTPKGQDQDRLTTPDARPRSRTSTLSHEL